MFDLFFKVFFHQKLKVSHAFHKKARHAFRLRHGEWIEGRTFRNLPNIAQKSSPKVSSKRGPQKKFKKSTFDHFWTPKMIQKCFKLAYFFEPKKRRFFLAEPTVNGPPFSPL